MCVRDRYELESMDDGRCKGDEERGGKRKKTQMLLIIIFNYLQRVQLFVLFLRWPPQPDDALAQPCV